MKFWTDSFTRIIHGDNALCIPQAQNHVSFGGNHNPHLAWSDLPDGTKSLVLICHDPDVPSRGDDVNQEGRTVPASLPRVDFFHWVLVDLPTAPVHIEAGEFSQDVMPRGKNGPGTAHGARQGLNDFTGWFANDKDMCGDYFGYDGPCPPWNDEIPHRYVFTLYALDTTRCPVEGKFTGQQVREAIRGHVLAEAGITGIYTLNPSVRL